MPPHNDLGTVVAETNTHIYVEIADKIITIEKQREKTEQNPE